MEAVHSTKGWALFTKSNAMLCMRDGTRYLSAFPFTGDVPEPFLVLSTRSAAQYVAMEWNMRCGLCCKEYHVKPKRVVVGIINRSQSETSNESIH